MSPFRAFVPYQVDSSCIEAIDNITDGEITLPMTTDPSATSWSTIGFGWNMSGEIIEPLDGAGYLFTVIYCERILPGRVIKEAIAEKIQKYTDSAGRKPNKKMIMEFKDDIVLELLPKAFIKRTEIPVMLLNPARDTDIPPLLVCFTSSPKRNEDITKLMISAFEWDAPVSAIFTTKPISKTLTEIARENYVGENFAALEAGRSVVLSGDEKRRIRVKDLEVDASEVQRLIKNGDYRAIEMNMRFCSGDGLETSDEPVCEFTLTEKFVVKGFKYLGEKVDSQDRDQAKTDEHAAAYIAASNIRIALHTLIEAMGGLSDSPTDEDEEL